MIELVRSIVEFILVYFGGLLQLIGLGTIAVGIKNFAHRPEVSSRWWDWAAFVTGFAAAVTVGVLELATYPGPNPVMRSFVYALYAFSGITFGVIFYSRFVVEMEIWEPPEDLAPFDRRVRGEYYSEESDQP